MTAPLREGSRGPEVLELQWLLRATGHDPGPLDGIFGPRTRAAAEQPTGIMLGGEVNAVGLSLLGLLPRAPVEMPRLHTPTTPEALREALSEGYLDAMERPVHEIMVTAVRVALAQLFVEHHEPGAPAGELVDLFGSNVGNMQVGAEDRDAHGSPTVPHFYMSPLEGSGSGAKKVRSPHYAFPPGPTGLEEGAAAYWRFLRDHCAPALAAFEAGDPARAAHELKIGAWHYSGSEADYARAMVDRFARLP